MSFTIRRQKENGLNLVILRDEDTATEVAILPEHGASLHGFNVRLAGNAGFFNVIDNYRDAAQLQKEVGISFQSSKLSPFPCRLDRGHYSFDGKDYQFAQLFKDGNAIHGLLYNQPFIVIEEAAGDGTATVTMEFRYNRLDNAYPFDYVCAVRYILHAGGMLEAVTTVTNLDSQVIPIADGWHPYFRLGGKVDSWEVQFHSSALVEFDERLIPTGQLVQYNTFHVPRVFGDTFLDNCFTVKQEIVSPACELFNPANGIRVSFFPDTSYPYLQIYTPATRDSIAVENLSGAPDCFNNKMGLTMLQPGHSQIFTTRYKVSVQ